MNKNHKKDKVPNPLENKKGAKHHSSNKLREEKDGMEIFIPIKAQESDKIHAPVINRPESEMLKVSHNDFLKFFPKVHLPQSLNEASIHDYSKRNKAFTEGAELSFLREPGDDEFTEYLPCFRVNTPEGIHVLVYWKAGLMDQHYYLMTMDKKGNVIARVPIAGIRSDGKKIARLYALIDESLVIHMTAGEVKVGEEHRYNPGNTKAFEAEIQPDGQIAFEESENLFDE